MSIQFNELPVEKRMLMQGDPDVLSKIDHIAKEVARKEELLFEQRVLRILEQQGLIVRPTGKED